MKVLYLLYSNIKVYPGNTRRIRKKNKNKNQTLINVLIFKQLPATTKKSSFTTHSSQSSVNKMTFSETSVILKTGEASAAGRNRCTCSFTLPLNSQ